MIGLVCSSSSPVLRPPAIAIGVAFDFGIAFPSEPEAPNKLAHPPEASLDHARRDAIIHLISHTW